MQILLGIAIGAVVVCAVIFGMLIYGMCKGGRRILPWLLMASLILLTGCTGCTMGRGAFAALNPLTWLKPSTYREIHRDHEAQEAYRKSQQTNQINQR